MVKFVQFASVDASRAVGCPATCCRRRACHIKRTTSILAQLTAVKIMFFALFYNALDHVECGCVTNDRQAGSNELNAVHPIACNENRLWLNEIATGEIALLLSKTLKFHRIDSG